MRPKPSTSTIVPVWWGASVGGMGSVLPAGKASGSSDVQYTWGNAAGWSVASERRAEGHDRYTWICVSEPFVLPDAFAKFVLYPGLGHRTRGYTSRSVRVGAAGEDGSGAGFG